MNQQNSIDSSAEEEDNNKLLFQMFKTEQLEEQNQELTQQLNQLQIGKIELEEKLFKIQQENDYLQRLNCKYLNEMNILKDQLENFQIEYDYLFNFYQTKKILEFNHKQKSMDNNSLVNSIRIQILKQENFSKPNQKQSEIYKINKRYSVDLSSAKFGEEKYLDQINKLEEEIKKLQVQVSQQQFQIKQQLDESDKLICNSPKMNPQLNLNKYQKSYSTFAKQAQKYTTRSAFEISEPKENNKGLNEFQLSSNSDVDN